MNAFYIVFSVIIAICALLSPMLVARANNKHQLELRKLEIQEAEQAHASEVIDGYFRNAGACLNIKSPTNLSVFGEYSNLIYFYLPEEYHADIAKLNNYLFSHTIGEEPIALLKSISVKYAKQYGKSR